jgi:hypothetical protein
VPALATAVDDTIRAVKRLDDAGNYSGLHCPRTFLAIDQARQGYRIECGEHWCTADKMSGAQRLATKYWCKKKVPMDTPRRMVRRLLTADKQCVYIVRAHQLCVLINCVYAHRFCGLIVCVHSSSVPAHRLCVLISRACSSVVCMLIGCVYAHRLCTPIDCARSSIVRARQLCVCSLIVWAHRLCTSVEQSTHRLCTSVEQSIVFREFILHVYNSHCCALIAALIVVLLTG